MDVQCMCRPVAAVIAPADSSISAGDGLILFQLFATQQRMEANEPARHPTYAAKSFPVPAVLPHMRIVKGMAYDIDAI
jgi:hypothetical protein